MQLQKGVTARSTMLLLLQLQMMSLDRQQI
jgi:hypothetical protein